MAVPQKRICWVSRRFYFRQDPTSKHRHRKTVTAPQPRRGSIALGNIHFSFHCVTAGCGCPPEGTPTEQPEAGP